MQGPFSYSNESIFLGAFEVPDPLAPRANSSAKKGAKRSLKTMILGDLRTGLGLLCINRFAKLCTGLMFALVYPQLGQFSIFFKEFGFIR